MSSLKTLIVLLVLSPMQSQATEGSVASVFAVCAGRFSAELEHAWLMRSEQASEIEHRRRQFVDLLDASVPPERQRSVLHQRIDAKVAHARLLSQAAFSDDPDRSEWAVRRARSEIAYCAGFLLKS